MEKREHFLEEVVFVLLLIIHIVYIWAIPVFLTQDGPTHLYNAKILLDLFLDNESSFYLEYLEINNQIFPNWFDHIILPLLLSIFSPVVAEKVFISLFMVSISFAFRYLIKTINSKATYLAPLIFIIANGYFLLFGFFNFQWNFVFFFCFLALFFKQKRAYNSKRFVCISILSLLMFFVHPIALVFVLFLFFLDIIINLITYLTTQKNRRKEILKKSLSSIISFFLPLTLFILYFSNQQAGNYNLISNNFNTDSLFILFSFNYLKVFLGWEHLVIALFILLILINLIPATVQIFRRKEPAIFIYIFGIMLFSLGIYFFCSSKMGGGGWLIPRITIFFYISLILLAATGNKSKTLTKVSWIGGTIVPILMLIVRYPSQQKISEITENYIQINEYLPKQITLLTLGFSNQGEFESKDFCPRLEIFKHISGYLGAYGTRILFDNYEANTQISPLKWKSHASPYIHLCKGGIGGIEMNPPSVDITSYNGRKGCEIDYVLTWGDPTRFLDTDELISIKNQLLNDYQLIHISSDKLSHLYKKRSH